MAVNPYTAAGAQAPGPGTAGAPQAGWQGLGGLLSFLQGSVNQQQQTNMVAGNQGNGFGAIGGAHGAASGLSPWAMSYLAQHLLTKNAAPQQALTGPDGQPLTGIALTMAQLQNSLGAGAPSTYSMDKGVTTDMLSQLLNTFSQDTGHSAFVKGFNATGQDAQPPQIVHGNLHPGQTVYGYGLHGGEFHSRAAAAAHNRLGKGAPTPRGGLV
jgi:hypothetical protein